MRSVLSGSREGILLVCFLSSKFECRISLSIMEFHYRISNCECHSVSVRTRIFSKTFLVWTRIFLKTDKKRCVFKNIRIRVDGGLRHLLFKLQFIPGPSGHGNRPERPKRQRAHTEPLPPGPPTRPNDPKDPAGTRLIL